MASTSTMVRPSTAGGPAPGSSGNKSPPRPPPPPPPPRRPPPPKSQQQQQRAMPPKSPKSAGGLARPPPPPPPPRRPPPPKRPSPSAAGSNGGGSPAGSPSSGGIAGSTSPSPSASPSSSGLVPVKRLRRTYQAPIELRDVNVFERMHKVGEGTYGSVFVGKDKKTGSIVALKRINTEQEAQGFPITAIREVKFLKALEHDNIVKLQEIVTSKEQGEIPKNVFMVFEYCDYDLTGLVETPEIRYTQDHVKSWSQQLLSGVHYMHKNKILHRDLKASNLLINKKGELRIADWGLARSWASDRKRMTNKVITLWYRPPELLLGCSEYTDKIDMWSVGCIIAEMFKRVGLFKGGDEQSQLNLIFKTVGHPTKETWPDVGKQCKLWNNFKPKDPSECLPCRIVESLKYRLPNPKWMTENAIVLIKNLLMLDPDKRWSAQEALVADYFFESPLVKTPDQLSMKFGVTSIHEWDCRKKFEQNQKMKAQAQAAAANNGKRP